MGYDLTYKPFGDCALLIEWPAIIAVAILNDVMRFDEAINTHLEPELFETTPAYHSILLRFEKTIHNVRELTDELKLIYSNLAHGSTSKKRMIKIPVCYDLFFGPDLDELAQSTNLSVQVIIDLHTRPVYTVYCIGFLPGFIYLGALDKAIHYPRKKFPRPKVDKGAVGIAGSQTGVYPQESPGGWNIIGNSPVSLFDAGKDPPCLAQPGDKVVFYSITQREHELILSDVSKGNFRLKMEVIDD